MCNCNYNYTGFNFKCGYRPITMRTINDKEELAKYLKLQYCHFFVRLTRKAYIARHNFKGTVTGGITEQIVAAQ